MILIVAEESDLHARYVKQLLEARDAEVRIFSPFHAGEGLSYRHGIGWESGASVNRRGTDSAVRFGEVETVWLRRPVPARIPESVVESSAREFIGNEWSEAVNGMLLTLDVRWVNEPLAQTSARKPRQLELARRVGLNTPDTLITNDPSAVREFVDRHNSNVVHKALTTPPNKILDTRKWTADAEHWLSALPLAPVMLQEYVAGPVDFRVVVVGEEVFSVKIISGESRSPVDSRLDLDAQYLPCDLPGEIKGQLLRLMSELNLAFGVADLKMNRVGDLVFLEVNPQGQFLFMEILTGLQIGSSVAEFLRRPKSS
jgi:hypothetical protein